MERRRVKIRLPVNEQKDCGISCVLIQGQRKKSGEFSRYKKFLCSEPNCVASLGIRMGVSSSATLIQIIEQNPEDTDFIRKYICRKIND